MNGSSSGELAIGSRVAVYWSDDDEYYQGKVKRCKQKDEKTLYWIKYGDGEAGWLDPTKTKFKAVKTRRKKNNHLISKLSVGTKVSVWWPREKEYFAATVEAIDPPRFDPHFLKYEDGDTEWVNLHYKKFHLGDWEEAEPSQKNYSGSESEDEKEEEMARPDPEEEQWEPAPKRPMRRYQCKRKLRLLDCAAEPSADTLSVGLRVSVWWPRDKESFAATVDQIEPSRAYPHFLKYDDGDTEWTNLHYRKYHLLDDSISVGSRVSVWWPMMLEYFAATVEEIDPSEAYPHFLKYDDGSTEWTNLHYKKYHLLDCATATTDAISESESENGKEVASLGGREEQSKPAAKRSKGRNKRKRN